MVFHMPSEPKVVWRPPERMPRREELEARVRAELRDVPGNVTVYITRSGSLRLVTFEPASLVGTFPSGTATRRGRLRSHQSTDGLGIVWALDRVLDGRMLH